MLASGPQPPGQQAVCQGRLGRWLGLGCTLSRKLSKYSLGVTLGWSPWEEGWGSC